MRGYDRDEVEDYDEYEDYGEEQEEEEEGEYEHEDEVERKPSAEELKYLQLRERIKERIRQKHQKQSDSSHNKSQDKKTKLPSNNYGSFFGSSQPVVAQRVIEESKSLLENQHLAFQVSNSHDARKKTSSTASGPKTGVSQKLPKVKNELQLKVQKLKDTRDYSFLLSDDAEPPAPTKEPTPRNGFTPRSDARAAPGLHKGKQPSSSTGRSIHGSGEDRKSHPTKGPMHSKTESHKSTSISKPNIDSRRQVGTQNGVGPGRPVVPRGLPLKPPVATMEKKASAPVAKGNLPPMRKPPSSNLQPSVPKQHLEQKRVLQEPHKAKVLPKQTVASSKPQMKKPLKHIQSHAPSQDSRLKKKPARRFSDDEDEDEKALSMIRRMFNTKRFAGREDDDSDMEANFDDIMREERRSAKIAREEDEEQLRLIEEEEQREQMRKLSKKRKLSH
uniref:Uncharacterized protein MANES_12G120000 n=1 Tax=Rhizophora mucronata TaxID=61149 RepID=A0A2P2LEN8_RHIMU